MDKGKLFRIICGVMMAIIVVILVMLFVSDDDASFEANVDMSNPNADTTEWMKNVADDKYISEISIPGTHNSCARNVFLGYAMRCQKTDIDEQLENGYRYLDFRVALQDKGGKSAIKMVHKFSNCHVSGNIFSDYLYFDDAVAKVYKFLDEHPSETVIINIKIEDDDHSVSDIENLLVDEFKEHSDYWYTDSTIPTLQEVRGKIVLATRYEDEAATGMMGLNMIWAEQDNTTPSDIPYDLYVNGDFRLWVQDRFKYDVEDKYEALVDGFENCEADDSTMFLNFASTSGDGPIGHPYGYAKTLNNLLAEYELKSNTSYGIVIVDFGTPNLARHIYYSNF